MYLYKYIMNNIEKQNLNLASKLEPKSVFTYFAHLCNIPHPSGHNKQISDYLVSVLKPVAETITVYSNHTVLARIKATKGCEKKTSVCLQAHCDMVPAKGYSSKHDFEKDPIQIVQKKGFLYANDTTLGADNGIGVAYALAIATDKKIKHGPLEILITTNEETNMQGAKEFPARTLKSKYLINLDNEETDTCCLGCNGGTQIEFTTKFARKADKNLNSYLTISLEHGAGGHSGNQIRWKIINAIKMMFSLFKFVQEKANIALVDINAGHVSNAISSECVATIALNKKDVKIATKILNDMFALIKKEFFQREANMIMTIKSAKPKYLPISLKDSNSIIDAINCSFNGVYSLDENYKIANGSSNLGIIETQQGFIRSIYLLRSAFEVCKRRIRSQLISAFYGTKTTHKITDDYPEWTPVIGNSVLQVKYSKIFKKFFNKNLTFSVTEGGLETGVLTKKHPGMEAISIGPDIVACHSNTEHVDIKGVGLIYKVLLETLKNI